MLPTSVSSWVSSWTSWGSTKAENRPRWWRYRWGSSRAVRFLIDSSIWGRLWLDKFTCRDKEKEDLFLKRFTETGPRVNDNQSSRMMLVHLYLLLQDIQRDFTGLNLLIHILKLDSGEGPQGGVHCTQAWTIPLQSLSTLAFTVNLQLHTHYF